MKHVITIQDLSPQSILKLINRALALKQLRQFPQYTGRTVAHLFYENSTRTLVSFELAAKRLGMTSINVDLQRSSESKGEVIEDTIKNLAAMGMDVLVIRHPEDHVPQRIADIVGLNLHIINAGDGKHAHPSQTLLDMMTVWEEKKTFAVRMAIVGNIRHSRVASSLQQACKILGVTELRLIAPEIWQPETVHFGHVTTSLKEGLQDVDAVMCLRVQKERISQHESLDLAMYHRDYALTKQALAYAQKDAMVMHPGPINRGVEITSEVADGPQSFILKQVENGVFMRMAILEGLYP